MAAPTAPAGSTTSAPGPSSGPNKALIGGLVALVVLLAAGLIAVLVTRGGDDDNVASEGTTSLPAGTGVPTSAPVATTTTTEVLRPSSVDVAVDGDAILGQRVLFMVQPDQTQGIDHVVLVVDGSEVARSAWPANDLGWVPTVSGDHEAEVDLSLDDGTTVSSDTTSFTVDLDPAVTSAIDRLAAALGAHDWATVRSIEPDKATNSDAALERGYAGLVRDTFVPTVAKRPRGSGSVRVHGGLVAEMQDKTRLFCATWDVDPVSGTVNELGKDGGIAWTRLLRDAPAGTTPDELQAEIEARCVPGVDLPG